MREVGLVRNKTVPSHASAWAGNERMGRVMLWSGWCVGEKGRPQSGPTFPSFDAPKIYMIWKSHTDPAG